MKVKHFSVKGLLLLVPRRTPFGSFEPMMKRSSIKLHLHRVFIMDDCEELMPGWFLFDTAFA